MVMPTLLRAGVHHALSLLCAYFFRLCPVACLLGEIPMFCDTGLHHYSSPLLIHVVLTPDVKTNVLKYILFFFCVQSRSESLQSRSGMPTPNVPQTPSYKAPSPLSQRRGDIYRDERTGNNNNWPHPPGMDVGFNRPPSRQSFMGTAAPQSPAMGVGRPASSILAQSPVLPGGAVVLPILPDSRTPVQAPGANAYYGNHSNWPHPANGTVSPLPNGFQTHSPVPPMGDGLPRGFVPVPPPPAPSLPNGFVPMSTGPSNAPLPSGFVPASTGPIHSDLPEGFIPGASPSMPQPPTTRNYAGPEPPPGFVGSAVIPHAELPGGGGSPRIDVAGALPIVPRGMEPWAGENTRSGSQTEAGDTWGFENDNAGEWGASNSPRPMPPPRSDAGSVGFIPPRPVSPRPPGVASSGGGVGPSFSRAGSLSAAPSRATSGFGPGFGTDPTLIALPPTTAPSLAYGRTNSSSSSGRENRRGGVYPYGDAPGSRSPSAKPVLGPQYGFGQDLGAAPALGRSNTFASPRVDARMPSSLGRSQSVMDGGATRSPRPLPVGMPGGMGTPGMPPIGLQSPYSRRLQNQDEYTNRDTPGNPYGSGRLPGVNGQRAPSPAPTNFTSGTRFARTTEGGESPRSRVYPRTPAYRASDINPDPDVRGGGREDIVIPGSPRPSALGMDRPLNAYTDRNPSLRHQGSKTSIASAGSAYKRYNPEEYVDPAILASGESRLLPKNGSTRNSKGGDGGFQFFIPD